jgi:hypothetical protein
MAANRSITLQGNPRINEEGVAAEAITPGHLVKGVTSLEKQTANGAYVPRTFALEREEMGDDIDVAYAIGDTVKVATYYPGCVALVYVASGSTVNKDTLLEASNDGTLKLRASGVAIARALADYGAITTLTRVRAEIM